MSDVSTSGAMLILAGLLGCGRQLPSSFTEETSTVSTAEDSSSESLGGESTGGESLGSESTGGESTGGESTDDGGGPPPLEVLRLVAGGNHVCAQWTELGVHCWGSGDLGQLGNGAFEDASTPQPVLDLGLDVVALGAGAFHSCATLESGSAMCWGHNLSGALGDGGTDDSPLPVAVEGLSGPAFDVSGGPAHIHTCAGLQDGTMMCWGENVYGQLGDGTTNAASTPQAVLGLHDVRDFAIGYIHTCAVDTAGQVSCWGWNPHGLIDAAMPADAPFYSPWPKQGLSDIVELSAGAHHVCALHADGAVSCWGYAGHGQLGDGSELDHAEPLPVAGLVDAVALAGGTTHNCAIRSGGTIVCWGHNFSGQLGDGTATERSTPVEVVGIEDASQVTVGDGFSCALSESRGVLCWGYNNYGQLGDGSELGSRIPVSVIEPS